ncbi:MAG TPA: hypothetical protein VMV75_11145 [Sulfuricella sp.]|nr:hypothetical protein [Sulfuricella sp.]
MITRMIIAVTLLALMASSLAGTAPPSTQPVKQQAQVPVKLGIGRTLKLAGFDMSLNKVEQPGEESLGGEGFTEYNLTLTNTSQDKELVVSNITFSVHGEIRAMVKDPGDIVNQGNSTGKSAATTAGAAAVGFVGGLLGPIGSLASMVGVNAAANKIYADDPQKWREEIKKRGFQSNDAGASVFPAETATGSIWVKQSVSEVAERVNLYVKQGNASRLVKLDLEGMQVAVGGK